MFRPFLIILLFASPSSAFTVWFNNINQADSTAVPILDNTGTSIEGGLGYVAAGTFSDLPTQITDFDDFQIFGEGQTSFNGVAPGFFDLRRSAPIPEGTTSSPVGERIYVVIGDGDSLSTSTDFAVFDSGLTFGTENLLGLGAIDVNITSNSLTADSLIVGDLLNNVDTGLGLTFEKAIQLTTVRQPLAPVLSPTLKDFYQSEEGEALSVDATPIDGFPSTYTYQWSYNGINYPSSLGGKRPVVTFTGNTIENGSWKVIVTNDAGSTEHTLTYRVFIPEPAPPTLQIGNFYETAQNQPVVVDATPIAGYPINFSYQWYFNGIAIAADKGGQERIFKLLGSTQDNGTWKVVVTNGTGSTERSFEYRLFSDLDGDGLSDYREQNILGTNFELADTDSDGLSDSDEVNGSTNPIVADTDNDGLLDGAELSLTKTDPVVADSDGDGVLDGEDDKDSDGLTNAQEVILYQTNPLLADTDNDGLSDPTEIQLQFDPNIPTSLEDIVTDFSQLRVEYDAVVIDRDSRFVDTDADGITDTRETELGTNASEATTFYLQDAYDFAQVQSLQAGRNQVTNAPEAYNLTPADQYNAVVADRDSRFVDTDSDGITDIKEVELETDIEEETIFYLKEAYDNAVIDSRTAGRSDVTSQPSSYNLTLTSQYNAIVADRDSRFVDSDSDGITDVKEAELNTNTEQVTIFYLKDAYDFAVNTSRISGQTDVTSNPQNFELTSLAAFNQVVTERDSRFIDTDGDGLTDRKESELFSDISEETTYYLQDSYDTAVANSRDSALLEVLSNPQNYKLKTEDAYNLVLAQRNSRFEDTDQDGITNIKEIERGTNPNEGTVFFLENAELDDAVTAARQVGRNDVMVFPLGYGLVSLDDYNSIIAERDERFLDSDGDGLTDFKEAELETSPLLETAYFLRSAYNTAVDEAREKGRSEIIESPQNFNLTTLEAFNAVISERDARPTPETYASAIAERDARFSDSDGDGITDLKEEELASNPNLETSFFLEEDQQATLQESRIAGQNDVLSNPQNFDLTTRAAFNLIAAQRDDRFLDSDGDGLTDDKEGELGTDATTQTSFYLENAFNNLFTDAKGAALEEVLSNLQNFGLTTKQAYDIVVEQRDSRFLDSDGDGLTDGKESELATDPSERTNFYLDAAYENIIAESLKNGRDEVTTNPQNFNLTTNTAYNALLAQRNERFLDSDGDGLTDLIEEDLETDPNVKTIFSINPGPLNFVFAQAQTNNEEAQATSDKPDFALATTEGTQFTDSDLDGITDAKEEELNTDPKTKTVFYLQNAFDNALSTSREAGRNDVTANPQNYELTPNAAYATLIAERDARFIDSDGDGITDKKEDELNSNASEETTFYLQDAYDSGLVNARQSGQMEVITNPQVYNFKTQEAYDLVISQRDARFIDSDGDGLTDDIESELETNSQEETVFYLQSALESAVTTAKIQGRDEVTTNPSNYDLTSQSLYNMVIAQRDSRPTEAAYQEIVAQRDERFVDSDSDGITDNKEAELSSNPQKATTFYLEGAYQDAVLNGRITGRDDVTRNPLDFGLTTLNAYNIVAAQRDLRPTTAAYNSILAQRDSRPTREEFNTVIQERDGRPTIGEIRDARLGSVVLQRNIGDNSVQLRFSIEETDDFKSWTKRDGTNEISIPLENDKKFYRFALENE